MTSREAFEYFVKQSLSPAKAERYAALMGKRKGEDRILASFDHEFEPAIRADVVRTSDYRSVWNKPCYIFHRSREFGADAATVRAARDELAMDDGWLILLTDGTAAIFRPESRWDSECMIVAAQS